MVWTKLQPLDAGDEMKTCFKCGQDKPLDDFYRHPAMKDGRLGKCKDCAKADVLQRRNENIEYVRAYDRARGALQHRVEARNAYKQTAQGKAAHAVGRQSYIARYPKIYAAHHAVANALRDGRIERKPCEWCGASKAHAHHFDYEKPLDVTWLCQKHHQVVHKADREHKRRDEVKRVEQANQ